jgi:hypothetical protein
MAPPAIEGQVIQVSADSITVIARDTTTSRSARLASNTSVFTQDGGWIDRTNLNTQQYVWIWFVECAMYDPMKMSEAAVIMVNVR